MRRIVKRHPNALEFVVLLLSLIGFALLARALATPQNSCSLNGPRLSTVVSGIINAAGSFGH